MTRFDAPESSPSRFARQRNAVVGTVSGNPGAVVATLFLTSLVLFIATALVNLTAVVPAALRGAFTASPTLVFVSPTASPADVDALGERLRALPMVANVTFRSKEVALAALMQAGLPAVAEGKNPLPDVWIVRLRLDVGARAQPAFVTTAVSARDAIASLAMVDRVRFDEGWVNLLDRATRRWSTFGEPAVAAGLILAVLAIACVHWLFARALRPSMRAAPSHQKSALAIVDLLVVSIATSFIAVAWSAIAGALADVGGPSLKPIADALGRSSTVVVAAAGAIALLVAWFGTAFVEDHE